MQAQPFVFDPFAVAVQDDPYPYYRVLRDRFPLYRNDERGFVALSRSADISAVLRDWEMYSNARGMDLDATGQLIGPGNFLDSDPPLHDDLRRIVRDGFRAQTVVRLEAFVREEVATLVEPLVAEPRVDIARELTSTLPIRVVSHIVGVPRADQDLFAGLLHRAATREGGRAEIPADSLLAHRELRRYFGDLIDERRWEDPDRLDVRRRPARHASFGEGIHFCLGAPLARLEARTVLARLLAVAPAYEVVGDPRRVRKVNSRGFEALELGLRPR